MKKIIKLIPILICFIIVFSLCSCSSNYESFNINAPSNGIFWKNKDDYSFNNYDDKNNWDKDLTQNTNITVIGNGNQKG